GVVAPANHVIDVHDCAWIDGVDGIHRDVVVVTVLRTVAGRGPNRGEAVQRLAVTVLVGAARPQAELLGKAVIEAAIEFVVARRRLAGQKIVVLVCEGVSGNGVRLWPELQQVPGDGVKSVDWNLVSGK